MAKIKYVARALNECFLGNIETEVVAYFVSKAYVDEGVVIRDEEPFVVVDFSSLFKKVPSIRRKGFMIENGFGIYKKLSFDTYEECNRYVERLNIELLGRKTAVLGEDRAVLKRHEKDVNCARKFELFYAGDDYIKISEDSELGE